MFKKSNFQWLKDGNVDQIPSLRVGGGVRNWTDRIVRYKRRYDIKEVYKRKYDIKEVYCQIWIFAIVKNYDFLTFDECTKFHD